MKTIAVNFLFICCSFQLFAQFSFDQKEVEMSRFLDSLRASNDDISKEKWNKELKETMFSTLQEPTIFEHQFTRLKTIGSIDSPDGLVRIVNWNIELTDGSQKYVGYVLHRDIKKNSHRVIELIDNSMMLPGKPDDILEPTNWYGALYYKIVPIERSGKTIYTVLGWDGGLQSSNTKLIDVISFTGNSLKLGQSIFKMGDQTLKRVFFEHSEKTVMSLKWDEEKKRIMFDHLSPETPSLIGFYDYYVPDFSYDALEYKGSKWVLTEDVIGINKEQESVHLNTMNPKTGEVVSKEVDNKWIDPTSVGASSPKEVHVAVITEETEETKVKNSKKDSKKQPLDALGKYENEKRHKRKNNSTLILEDPKKKKRRD